MTKPKQLFIFLLVISHPVCGVDVGDICHVEAEAYYPGVWEEYGDDELICNYWRWLGIENPEFEDNTYMTEE
ncbi:hypothetical protein SAMN05660772_02460 [Pasteurella testudinis DSM 23072]|uniref:Uncharacterized protein n=1 Tax=Pasteurella testudinis DSM 23072 TaxID=1122938 RepID=A0A1W1UX35_9PAST|nr:hypothetical protein [Pasteurella testudinis]SMB85264.1 hypothetical protein SAMN05660772_02460 [Pasteurella testudinis DSM 23072]SUB52149.1 Uncharacterised protein [Pasteurella testudinis]